MAKVQIKSEKLTPFGGVFHVMELFERHLSHIIDGALGKRSVSIGYDLLLSGKTFQTKQIRADTSHEVSALLVIFVLQKNI